MKKFKKIYVWVNVCCSHMSQSTQVTAHLEVEKSSSKNELAQVKKHIIKSLNDWTEAPILESLIFSGLHKDQALDFSSQSEQDFESEIIKEWNDANFETDKESGELII